LRKDVLLTKSAESLEKRHSRSISRDRKVSAKAKKAYDYLLDYK